MTGQSFFPYLVYFINILLKHPTWSLSHVITSDINLLGWSWRRLCVHCHGMTTFACAPSRVLSHINYINSDWRCHFLICGYGIFPSLHNTIYYLRNTHPYDLWISYFSPLSPCCGDIYLCHFPLYPSCILSSILLYPHWIRFLFPLSPCWTRFLLSLT